MTKFRAGARQIQRAGGAGYVGGQEGMLIDIALSSPRSATLPQPAPAEE
jgi:hypothetical protein